MYCKKENMNVVNFTRYIFIGRSKDTEILYFLAIDYYERVTLVRSIITILPELNIVFVGQTIGIEKK